MMEGECEGEGEGENELETDKKQKKANKRGGDETYGRDKMVIGSKKDWSGLIMIHYKIPQLLLLLNSFLVSLKPKSALTPQYPDS